MVASFTSYIVENDVVILRALTRLSKQVDDMRIPFGLISKEFFQGNKKIFSLKGPGKYPKLGGLNPTEKVKFEGREITKRERAEITKKREVGFIYPLLKRSGDLEKSLTNPRGAGAINVRTKRSLFLGTAINYAVHHQFGTTKMNIRKPVFIDGGPLETSVGSTTSGRRQAWINIIDTYIKDNVEEFNK